MPFNTSECQRVQGAMASKEYVLFDSEDHNNQNARNGSYPFVARGGDHQVFYCYYEGKGLMSVFVQLCNYPPLTTDDKLGVEVVVRGGVGANLFTSRIWTKVSFVARTLACCVGIS